MSGFWTNSQSRSLIGGHRGASAVAVENSAAAFSAALAGGADFIETDVRLTADGVPVALHDADLLRLTGTPRRLADLTLSEARQRCPGLLTIPEVLQLAEDRAGVLLDVKLLEGDDLSIFAQGLEAFARPSVALGLRSLDAVDALDGHLTDCPRLGLFRDIAHYPALAVRGGTWARLWQSDATPDAIARLRDHGLRVIVMTGEPTPDGVGEIEDRDLADLLDRAPDALLLNDPGRAVALRRQRQAHSSAASSAEPHHPIVKRSTS